MRLMSFEHVTPLICSSTMKGRLYAVLNGISFRLIAHFCLFLLCLLPQTGRATPSYHQVQENTGIRPVRSPTAKAPRSFSVAGRVGLDRFGERVSRRDSPPPPYRPGQITRYRRVAVGNESSASKRLYQRLALHPRGLTWPLRSDPTCGHSRWSVWSVACVRSLDGRPSPVWPLACVRSLDGRPSPVWPSACVRSLDRRPSPVWPLACVRSLDGRPSPVSPPASRLLSDGRPSPVSPPASSTCPTCSPAPPWPPASSTCPTCSPAPPSPPASSTCPTCSPAPPWPPASSTCPTCSPAPPW